MARVVICSGGSGAGALRLGAVLAALLALAGPAFGQTAVKLGILNDQTGIYSARSGEGSQIAARMAVEDFAPAKHGLAVEIVVGDHRNAPETGVAIARDWYERQSVDAIFDVPTSSVALAVSQLTREKNKVLVDTGAGTADLTGSKCTPNTIHWVFDTIALANGTGGAMLKRGGDTWFIITADYAFGHAMQRDLTAYVVKNGGRVVGSVKTPFPGADFAPSLLQAQRSGAKVIALANAGGDTINAVIQAGELGISGGAQALAGLLVFSSDVHSLGPGAAQGLVLTEPFYWDLNASTRAFSDRFARLAGGAKPTSDHAGVYSAILHYLKAVADQKSALDGAAIVARMKAMPTDDPVFGRGTVREDGRKIHDMHLFEVKKPSESRGEWDLYKRLATIPGEAAFRSLKDGGCPLVKGGT